MIDSSTLAFLEASRVSCLASDWAKINPPKAKDIAADKISFFIKIPHPSGL